MTELKVVPFDLSMLNECIDLYQKVFSKEPWFENDERSSIERMFLNFYNNSSFLGYIAIYNEKTVAVSIGFLKPWIKGLEYYIDQFYVDYEQQGKGIGTAFLTHIRNDLIKQDIHAMILLTEKQYPAFDFYVKNGFSSFEDMRFLGISI